MEPTIYTTLKVNNEIELCEVASMDCKGAIEKVLLKNRISYFVKFTKPGLFRRKHETCIFCINENDRDVAEKAILSLGKGIEQKVEFLMNKSSNDFF